MLTAFGLRPRFFGTGGATISSATGAGAAIFLARGILAGLVTGEAVFPRFDFATAVLRAVFATGLAFARVDTGARVAGFLATAIFPAAGVLADLVYLRVIFLATAAFLAIGFLATAFLAIGFLTDDFLAVIFLAVAFVAAAFLATSFLAAGFLATSFLTAVFLAATFFVTAFFATAFFATVFFAATFLGPGFLATSFLTATFFATAFFGPGFLAKGFLAGLATRVAARIASGWAACFTSIAVSMASVVMHGTPVCRHLICQDAAVDEWIDGGAPQCSTSRPGVRASPLPSPTCTFSACRGCSSCRTVLNSQASGHAMPGRQDHVRKMSKLPAEAFVNSASSYPTTLFRVARDRVNKKRE